MRTHTEKPFQDAIRQLVEETLEEDETRSLLERAGTRLRALVILKDDIEWWARELGVEPEYFIEYREHLASVDGAGARRGYSLVVDDGRDQGRSS